MANLYRLALLVVTFTWLSPAFASFPLTPATTNYRCSNGYINSADMASAAAACESIKADFKSRYWGDGAGCTLTWVFTATGTQTPPAFTTNTGVFFACNGGGRTGSVTAVGVAASCPANSTQTGSVCQCDSGFMEDDTSPKTCKPVPVCPAGQSNEPLANYACMPTCTPPKERSVGLGGVFNGCLIPAGSTAAKCANAEGTKENYYSTPAPAATDTVCAAVGPNAGCAISVSWQASVTSGGVKTLYGIGVVSGKTCDQAKTDNAAAVPPKAPPIDSDKPGAPAPTPCKPGTAPGTINGTSVCMPTGTSSEPQESTDTTKTTNADGSTTTKQTTTSCSGSSCTTTTTTTVVPVGGGAGTTTTTKDEKPKQKFCEENPEVSMCKASMFGGSCLAGFTCDGDALQCSIAREQYTRNCQMFDKVTPESALYDVEKVKTGDQTTALPGNQSVALSASSFSQAPVFASAGLSDLHVTVAGKDNTIDLSRLNSWLEILGYIGVSVTALVCVRVVFGGGA